jgi:hypothetical protein
MSGIKKIPDEVRKISLYYVPAAIFNGKIYVSGSQVISIGKQVKTSGKAPWTEGRYRSIRE